MKLFDILEIIDFKTGTELIQGRKNYNRIAREQDSDL